LDKSTSSPLIEAFTAFCSAASSLIAQEQTYFVQSDLMKVTFSLLKEIRNRYYNHVHKLFTLSLKSIEGLEFEYVS